MNKFPLVLSFDDILITPKFSNIVSRKDVDISSFVSGYSLKLPIISSNMDSVTELAMSDAMFSAGGIGCLHRFMSIEHNVKMYNDLKGSALVSVGIGPLELERFEALTNAGANGVVLDVAHGSAMHVVQQVKQMQDLDKNVRITVGNFATSQSIKDFLYHLGNNKINDFKVGVGSGSACTTRIVTGCGLPTFASVLECSQNLPGINIIADGGIKGSGDFAKVMAAGASAVMMGKLLAGSDESPEKLHDMDTKKLIDHSFQRLGKKYRGSASKESYEVQGKIADHRVAEGDSFLVPYTGPVKNTLNELAAGLRSALSYVGANNLKEFRENAEFVRVTSNGHKESNSHGKS